MMYVVLVQHDFLCPGWIYEMYAICSISLAYSYVQNDFLYPGWIYKMYAIYNIRLAYFYVQHGFMKCLLKVILAFLFLMSNVIYICIWTTRYFYVQDEARKLGWKSQMTDLEFRKKDETYIIWIHKWSMSETDSLKCLILPLYIHI